MSNTRDENQSGESSDEEECKQGKRKDVIGRKMFKCVICSKQYNTLKTLKQHIQSHVRKRKCEICEKSFTRLEKLLLHQKNVHGIHKEKKPKLTSFTCKVCNKTFENII